MVIESGTAEVTHDGTHLADLGPGDFFGEMALPAERASDRHRRGDLRRDARRHARSELPGHGGGDPRDAQRVNAIMEERRAKSADQGIET